MRYLLDTVTLGEPTKVRPDPGVTHWIQTTDPGTKFISILTIAEARRGIAMLRRRDPNGAAKLVLWLDSQRKLFADRVLPVDDEVAALWGELNADRTLPVMDSLIAATALAHDLTLVTRNTRDFAGTGVKLVNPWRHAIR